MTSTIGAPKESTASPTATTASRTSPESPAASNFPTSTGPAEPAAPSARNAPGDWAFLILPGLIWGASYLFIAESLRSIAPNGLTFVRIAIGFIILSLVPAARQRLDAEDRWKGAALGILWMAFPLSMFPFAEERVSSALTGMLSGAVPLCAAAIASILARRPPSRAVAIGLAVGFTGVFLMGLTDLRAQHAEGAPSQATGVLLILAAHCSYGIAINLARPLQQRNGALPVVWNAQAVALLLTAPLGLPEVARAHWTPGPLAALLTLGVFGTGIAFVLQATAAGRLGATRAATTSFIVPAVALVLGLVFRHEHVAALSMIGAAVCLTGVWLIR
jgi:drug/metabolite transporter (DMT)-like permease